jgi:glucose/arabinose dehydrogenase
MNSSCNPTAARWAPLALLAGLAASAVAQSLPTGFRYEAVVATGLSEACSMSFAPDGRLFVCERLTGCVRVVRDGVLEPQPWFQIPYAQAPTGESGLLGIAVDPGFLANGYVYLYYTDPVLPENRLARVRDVQGSGVQHTVLSPAGALPVHPFRIHNGGRMVFGHDGRLYVASGDAEDHFNPQNPSLWPGKILCLDVPNLTVPVGNPIPGSPAFALGFRNSFGLAVHPTQGWLFASENGYLVGDELNRVVAGGNYGWPQYEGGGMPAGYEAPLLTLPQQPVLTGMAFHWGPAYPSAYQGALFVCQWGDGEVRKVDLSANGQAVLANQLFASHGHAFDVQLGPDGNVWVLHGMNGQGAEEIGRYVHSSAPAPMLQMSPVNGPSLGGSVTFGVTARTGSLALAWVSFTTWLPPVPSAYGPITVPADAVLPIQFVAGDDRCYMGVALPNLPAFLGAPLHAQALTADLATGAVALTNPTTHVLR